MNTNSDVWIKNLAKHFDNFNHKMFVKLRNPLTGFVEKYVQCPHTDELIEKYGWEEVK